MKTSFTLAGGRLIPTDSPKAKVRIFTMEEEGEREEVMETVGADPYDIDAALDPDEIARVEFKRNLTSIIWKRPYRLSGDDFSFGVSSAGLFLHDDMLTVIISKENLGLFLKEQLQRVNSATDVLLKYFFYTVRKYLQHLKDIKRATTELESRINSSMENKAFLQMFDVSESLIYYLDAIEANGGMLMKLRDSVKKAKGCEFSMKQIEYLDDVILENKQCARQAQIYSTVLSGLMDARGNIINNNVNVLLKNLTLINVIFLPLNLIAGMGGMSEFTMMMEQYNIGWQISYPLFTLAMALLAWLMWIRLRKWVARGGRSDARGNRQKSWLKNWRRK